VPLSASRLPPRPPGGPPRVLLVEPNRATAVRAAEHLAPWLAVVLARTSAEAGDVLGGHEPVDALVVREWLADGSGLALAARVRGGSRRASILVIADAPSASVTAECFRLDADQLIDPVAPEQLHTFARRAVDRARAADARIAATVVSFGARFGLTARQREALDHAARGVAPCELAASLGVGAQTARGHIARILARTGERRLDPLIRRILREAIDA
jgi:DNA-binding NarL/FixJ family response regulator